MPATEFPMRANLAQREPEILKLWDEMKLYHKIREARKDKPLFVIHDGPPFANGDIHLGTALNKILKDMVIKSKLLLGWNIHYRPGWDCHGLPIEMNITQEMTKGKKEEIEPIELRKRCAKYALKFVDKQRQSFKRLGVLGEWERPYLTLKPQYEAEELRQFAQFVRRGCVYQGLKPVYWCSYLQTALAEAEVEYEEHTSPAIYVRFPLTPESSARLRNGAGKTNDKPINGVIWTTTPWTLPANRAVCFHPNFIYALLPLENEYVLIAKDLVSRFLQETGLTGEGEPIGSFTGKELEQLRIQLQPPFSSQAVPLICGSHVTLEQGTGAVHTAPGHGHEDYLVGLEYNLEVFSPVDHEGRFTEKSPVCRGLRVEEANQPILEKLKEAGLLVHHKKLVHSYPHCWRSKKPIIFRATRQWFISLEKDNLRQRLLETIDKVNWIPSWGRQRIRGMVENRQEWCISRQRSWGVPIPAVYFGEDEEAILDAELIEEAAEIVAKEGTDFWFRAIAHPEELQRLSRLKELIPEGKTLADVRLEKDILDVWFDSGSSHHAVMANEENYFPVDMYLEGSDQHRGWFQSSLVISLGAGHEAPYKTVLTHGFTVDEKGRKLSKSLGNYVSMDDLVKQAGADVIRLWIAAEDFRGDMTFSDEIFKRIMESYRRIRNTARFLLSNLNGYSPSQCVPESERLSLDRWILNRWRECKKRISDSYERYDFHRIFYDLNNFCSVDLSAVYLDVIKDRLYVSGKENKARRAAQSTLAEIAVELTACAAPILTFTSEEIWSHLRKMGLAEEESVYLYELNAKIPEADPQFMMEWDKRFMLRAEAIKTIEQARKEGVIGHSLDCRVLLDVSNKDWRRIIENAIDEPLGDDLASVCIVSQIVLEPLSDRNGVYESAVIPGLKIAVVKAAGEKCPRCWRYDEQIGGEGQDICPRCREMLVEDRFITA
ncbi:MAG: isoleucine--tRNA ligase [Candidatus Omnitrophota bacterium]